MHGAPNRKSNGKTRAAAFTVLRNDFSAVRLDQLPGDGKTQAEPARPAARRSIEFVEHSLFFARSQARPGIGNGKDQRAVITPDTGLDWFFAAAVHRGI